ncbi:hypothetical protein ACFQ9X_30110 [Catenulispora yoronensis]
MSGGDGSDAATPMESALRDGFDHPVRLVPLVGPAQLVLQEDRVSVRSSSQQRDFYYLVPSGSFALAAGDSTPPASRVMCGLSPLETVVFDPPGSVITFHPDADAFSPLLAATTSDGSTPRLSDRFRTAWATITAQTTAAAAPTPIYLAQAEGAALFGHSDASSRSAAGTVAASAVPPSAAPFLEHQETPAAALRDPTAAGAFPLVPYGQLVFGAHPDSFTADDVARLERDVLAVERRARVTATGTKPTPATVAGTAFATAPPTRVTTPQGFVVDLAADGGGAWKRLHLAQTSWSPDPGRTPPTTSALAFTDVDDALRAAFQTNQQFLVVTNPALPWNLSPAAGAATTIFEDELSPQGWPFTIRTGANPYPGDYRNILIFKFCDGTVDARVEDFATWTAADQFNTDPADVAAWLRTYIDDAKALADGPDGAYFAKFVEAVTTASWRGVLALRVDVDASAMPQELRGLAAGIDLADFNAHHVGVDLSFVDTSGGDLQADGDSSVFATVYYVDPAYAAALAAGAPAELPVPVPSQADYAFSVLSLKTLFANAEITAFASKTQVTLNRLFGEQVSGLTLNGLPTASNSLVLDGTYENHDGTGVYVFATDADARFSLVSNLWRAVEVTRAAFSTLRADTSSVLSRFDIQGFLDFATVSGDDGTARGPFDVLSFGGTGTGPDPTGTGLPFAALHLDMTFATASPAHRRSRS